MPNLIQYKNALSSLARPNQFQVSLFFPTGINAIIPNLIQANQAVKFMVKNATIPKSEIGTMPIKVLGRPIPMPGDRTFEAMSVTVFNDEAFTIRRSLEAWMGAMQPHTTTGSLQNFGPLSSLNTTTVYVSQLGRDGLVKRTYAYENAFPTVVNEVGLDWTSDNAPEEYSVTFQYSWWTTVDSAVIDSAAGI